MATTKGYKVTLVKSIFGQLEGSSRHRARPGPAPHS